MRAPHPSEDQYDRRLPAPRGGQPWPTIAARVIGGSDGNVTSAEPELDGLPGEDALAAHDAAPDLVPGRDVERVEVASAEDTPERDDPRARR